MKRVSAAIAAVVATAPGLTQPVPSVPGSSAPGLTLHLVCRGIGDHEVRHGLIGTVFGRHGAAATAIGSTGEQDQFGEQMDINIEGSTATTRVPRRFLPPQHGGNDGMFDIKDMVVTEDTIPARC